MRKLMWFTIGFSLGCGLCVTLLWQRNLLPVLLYGLCCCGLCVILWLKNDLFRYPMAVFLGLSLSLGWFFLFQRHYLQPLAQLDGNCLELSITVTDYSEATDYGCRVSGSLLYREKPYRVVVYHDLSLIHI